MAKPLQQERLECFKAYDVRGVVPDQLNEEVAWRIGRGYAAEVRPKGPVAVGRDVRHSSEALAAALIRGLNEGGVDTVDIGLCGTEMIYFAASRPGMGGGIMVTASHNPAEYNGMKFVREQAIPISGDSGLDDLERRVRTGDLGEPASTPGTNRTENILDQYVEKLLSFVDVDRLKPLRIVVNPGNGCAGPVIDALAARLPFEFIRINFEPDGSFPNGIPNPLLPENRPVTADAVRTHKADLGLAWDGDFDRCFFFDERGEFVDGYYIVGLLAKAMLQRFPGEKIIYDPRMTWNTIEIVRDAGGVPIQNKTGHAFMKERMRKENAVYGGEMSAHHYFRDFAYCDSGMIPWLLITSLICETGRPLSSMVEERRRRFPGSGEINWPLRSRRQVQPLIERIEREYRWFATKIEHVDGLSMEFGYRWRFNLRPSQTEPILRLNVESWGDPELLTQKTEELKARIERLAKEIPA